MKFFISIILCFLCFSSQTLAQTETILPDDLAIDHLAKDKTWRGLIGFRGNDQKSDILNPEFFYAPNGKKDPIAELKATVVEALKPIGDTPQTHAYCRFPARILWLRQQNLIPKDPPPQLNCAKYKAWIGDLKPTGASIIFASGDLSNPATFYGHMMLRITTGTQDQDNSLLENIISNGAIFPPKEGPIAYVTKGLIGAYKATYTKAGFYEQAHSYSELQLRDVWEYRLNLSPDQLEMLTAHSFELNGAFNSYYFLRQNCAYRIATLVDVAMGSQTIPAKLWTMPVDVLETMSQAKNEAINGQNNENEPLIRSIVRLDSRRTELRDHFISLNMKEKARVKTFLHSPNLEINPILDDLSVDGQMRVSETLLDYFSVSQTIAPKQQDDVREIQRRLMVARLKLPAGKADFGEKTPPLLPNQGNRSTFTQLSIGSNSLNQKVAHLRMRFAYNDFLSITPGALPFSELAFGDVGLNYADKKLGIERFEIVRITTLNISQTGLPGDGGYAWRARIGVDKPQLGCQSCLTSLAEGNIGKSTWLSKSLIGYGLAGGRLTGNEANQGVVQLGLTGGLILNAGKKWRSHIESSVWQDVNGQKKAITRTQFSTRYALNRALDLTMEIRSDQQDKHDVNDLRIGLGLYL